MQNAVRAFILPAMSLNNAALLALVGTILAAILLVADFIRDVLNVLRDLIPTARMFTSLLYAFASVTVVIFLYVFYKAQSK